MTFYSQSLIKNKNESCDDIVSVRNRKYWKSYWNSHNDFRKFPDKERISTIKGDDFSTEITLLAFIV